MGVLDAPLPVRPDGSLASIVQRPDVIDAADMGPGRTQVEINQAIQLAASTGVGRVRIKASDGPWMLARYSVGNQGGSILIDHPNITLVFDHTTLILTSNSTFISARSTLGAQVTVTADTLVTDSTLAVTSSASFTVGQNVFVRLGQAAYDSAEPDFWIFAKVLAVPDGTHVTLDQPVGYAMSVAATPTAAQRSIAPITAFVENVALEGTVYLVNPVTTANAESGFSSAYVRNVRFDTVVGTDTGANVVGGQFIDGLTGRVIRSLSAIAQNGQASKGRIFSIAECRGVNIDLIQGQGFELAPITFEGRCEAINLGQIVLDNNLPTRDNTKPLIVGLGNNRAHIGAFHLKGAGTNLSSVGGTTGNDITFDDGYFYTSTRTVLGPGLFTRRLFMDGALYTQRRTWRKYLAITPSMSSVVIAMPAGQLRKMRVFSSTLTGLTAFQVGATSAITPDISSSLIAGKTVDLAQCSGYGSGYNASADTGKRIVISTGSTVPPGAYMVIETDYWADPAAPGDDDLPATAGLGLPGVIIGAQTYNPGSDITFSSTITTDADVSTTNAAVTFVAPTSGQVWVTCQLLGIVGGNTVLKISLRESGATLAGTSRVAIYQQNGSTQIQLTPRWLITGLTPGTTHTYTLGFLRASGTGPAEIHAGTYGGPLSLVVQAA